MTRIQSFKFHKDNFDEIRKYRFGSNWPVVYVAEDKKEVYVGETVNAYNRSMQHYEKPERKKLSQIHIITDEEFNKSAALDIESWIIQYMSADGKFLLQNGNGGLQNHNYYDKQKYKAKFESVWAEIIEKGLAIHTKKELDNSDLFKYSPYKSLTEDQYNIATQLFNDIKAEKEQTYIINGRPGTGKTILATYLLKFLKEKEETKDMEIALVIAMTSLRETIGNVFKNIKGLKKSMVIGPNDVIKKNYDLLIVDEAHRLQRRKNIMGLGAYDKVNNSLCLPKEATQLDWILKSSKLQILFYDENQSVKPSDIKKEDFKKLKANYYTLTSQMRINAGDEYIDFIEDVFDLEDTKISNFENYDFKLYEDIKKLFDDIKQRDKDHGLSRVVAGYAWPWHTNPKNKTRSKEYDIDINGLRAVWNSTAKDWVNSPNAVNEVGCIHTVQGYDLNYVGVIIGPEFGYDPKNKKFFVDKKKYFDRNGHAGVQDPAELENYVKNIYKTLLTRGIKGTYIYVVNKALRDYFQKVMTNSNEK